MSPKDKLMLQKKRKKEIVATPRQIEAQPRQIGAAPQQTHPAAGPAFAQPTNVEGTAPVPETTQMPQQQQLTRKERRALRKEEEKQQKEMEQRRRETAKRMAHAKLTVDALVAKMKANPIPGEDATDYHGTRPLETFSEKSDYLERVILSQIKDERIARKLLEEVRVFDHHAVLFDREAHEFRFRNQNVPIYITDVLHQQVPEDVDRLLVMEAEAFSDANYGIEMMHRYAALEKKVFEHLSEAQTKQATSRSMRKGEEAQAYTQAIETLMEREHISRGEAKHRYHEEKLRQGRPLTLRRLEEQRRSHFEDRGMDGLQFMEEEMFHSVEYANEDIQKAHPGAPKLDWKAADELTTAYIRDATKNISYQMRVPNCRIMGLILQAGRFKTQMETNASGGALQLDLRKQFTRDCFGADTDTLPPEQYEIYGYASHGDLVKESTAKSIVGQGVGQYGQVVVKLKKEAMQGRTTMTIGDSLDARKHARPNWVDQPDLHAVSAKARMTLITGAYEHRLRKEENPDHTVDLEDLLQDAQIGYAELQYHGGLRVEDIESVTLIADFIAEEGVEVEQEMPHELVDQLKTLGIKAKIVKDGKESEL